MATIIESEQYDVIIVGSGTCGATLAKELTDNGKKVLVIEKGGSAELKETVLSTALIADEAVVAYESDNTKLATMRAVSKGGSTALYFAVADEPPIDLFKSYGIDLTEELDESYREIPIAELPDELLGPQSIKVQQSALELGFPWAKKKMFVDVQQCKEGYSYAAKWKARNFLDSAILKGAAFIDKANVEKVIVENDKAVAVEYSKKTGARSKNNHRVYGEKIILAAGVLSSPQILRNTGFRDAGQHGFYCDPNFAVCGTLKSVGAKDNYAGCMSADLGDDIVIGDANMQKLFFRLVMLAELKFSRAFSFSNSIAVGGVVRDGLGGSLLENGRYHKMLTESESAKLIKGEEAGIDILKNAGAKNITRFSHAAGYVGGVVRIGEHIDEKFQYGCENLHLCDGSIIPENIRLSPTLTLVCLAKYLSKKLIS